MCVRDEKGDRNRQLSGPDSGATAEVFDGLVFFGVIQVQLLIGEAGRFLYCFIIASQRSKRGQTGLRGQFWSCVDASLTWDEGD